MAAYDLCFYKNSSCSGFCFFFKNLIYFKKGIPISCYNYIQSGECIQISKNESFLITSNVAGIFKFRISSSLFHKPSLFFIIMMMIIHYFYLI